MISRAFWITALTVVALIQSAKAEDAQSPSPRDRSKLLDFDWRKDLANDGVSIDAWLPQFYQGALSGDGAGLGTIGIGLRDEQGIEVFYNYAVTPWFSVTGDLQFVQPVRSGASTALTASLRTRTRF